MSSRTRLIIATTLSFIGLSAQTGVSAHDIWIVTTPAGSGGEAAIAYGDTDARVLPEKSKIVSYRIIGAEGASTDLRPSLKAGEVAAQPVFKAKDTRLQSGAIVALTYDNGFWIKQAGDVGSTNTSRLMAPDGTSTHWTVKFAKALFGKGAYSQPANTRMELVPLKDPYMLKPGERLPVRVVAEGKPVANADIRYGNGVDPIPDDKTPRVKTGADGIALVPITGTGPQLLAADLYVPPMDRAYSEGDHLYASLTFDLRH